MTFSVLSHSLHNNSLTDESIPHLTELIESARNLETLDLQYVVLSVPNSLNHKYIDTINHHYL